MKPRFLDDRKQGLALFGSVLSLLGFLFVFFEITLRLQGKTLCHSTGCKLATSLTGNDFLILCIGALFFVLLAILFFFINRQPSTIYYFIELCLLDALAVEGYLVGLQTFVLHTFCHFCLTCFGFVLLIALFYALAYKKGHFFVLGVSLFCALWAISYLVSPAYAVRGKPKWPPPAKLVRAQGHYQGGMKVSSGIKWFLFVSEDCPHCKRVLNYILKGPVVKQLNQGGIDLFVCEAERCKEFLEDIGISEVPVLLIDEGVKKTIFVGDACIMSEINKLVMEQIRPKQGGGVNIMDFLPQEEDGVCKLNGTCQ